MAEEAPLALRLAPAATQLNAPGACASPSPHACDAWNARGNAASVQGEWAEAAEAYGQAIALGYRYHHYIHFDCSALHTERARLHLAGGNTGQAEEDVREAVFQDHGNPLKDWRPGQPVPDYAQAGPLEDDWQRNIALPSTEGQLPEAYFHPGVARYRALHRAARTARTIAAYDAAIAAAMEFHRHYHRHAAQHHLNRGLAYFRLAYLSLSPWGKVAEREPDKAKRDAVRGDALFHPKPLPRREEGVFESRLTLALNDFSKACDLDKLRADAWRCRGDARAALGNLRGAQADYARARASLPLKGEGRGGGGG